MKVTRRFEIDAAHRLPRHTGKCKNLHGHRYVFEVTVDGLVQESGVVIDFAALKELVGGWLDRNWDHATLVWVGDNALRGWCEANEQHRYELPRPPTIENLVRELAGVVSGLLKPHGLRLQRIRGHETPGCWAEWEAR